ncbi:hypothetical protein IFM89_024666 [Coptis chinensis]|uniref:Choline kinase n=1 Tax=Coptis chinensis TaxID=261450 RepID=A0A835M407_9MAGN|nr:hypothetical protein IFM89_024666 [Coptis chinensis]
MGVKNDGGLPKEAKKILQSLASAWDDVIDSSTLEVIPIKGAMTNAVFQVNWSTEKGKLPQKVLLRIYGEGVEVFFDRSDEIRTFECMSKHGQGPRLLGRFPNGRVEEFIHARTLSACDLRDPEISALIAIKLKEFHDLHMPGPKNVILWNRLRNWLSASKRLCSPDEAKAFRLDAIELEISLLEKELSGENQNVGFCHNDLQYGNIMIDEETRSITIIDYEYSCYNPVAFDLANHFCEMAADYHTETPHVLDYDKYPGLEERQRFVRAYLSSSGNEPSNVVVQQMVEDAEKYTLASHLFWGLWGIISEKVNEIDFEYMEYARQRFQQYWSSKSVLLENSKDVAEDGISGCALGLMVAWWTDFGRWQARLGSAALILGIVGNICIAFLFFPVARGSSVSQLIGLTSECSVKYQIWLGHIVMTLFTAHDLCYIVYLATTDRISELTDHTI